MRLTRLVPVWGLLGCAALLCASDCATPTALLVDIYSEVPCSAGATVALIGSNQLADLATKAPSAESTECTSAGAEASMGRVVLIPPGAKNESIVFALMTRPDGQPPDSCLDPTNAGSCIVVKREILFLPRTELDMRVDLRLSCLGIPCPLDQTCVNGACVSAVVNPSSCVVSCGESSLEPDDAGAGTDAAPDAPRDSGADAAGGPVTIASSVPTPRGIAVDDTSVYWTSEGDSTVSKAPLAGGPSTILAMNQDEPVAIAVNATTVYWVDGHGQSLHSVPKGGGVDTTLSSAEAYCPDVALDSASVYWICGTTIDRMPLGGGAVTTLAMGQSSPSSLAVNATGVYWTNSGPSSGLGAGIGSVNSVPLGGGSVATLSAQEPYPFAIAVDATSVYWIDEAASGSVKKVGIGGGAVTTLASGEPTPYAIAIDASSVYWADLADTGAIKKVPLAGGAVTTLATPSNPWSIAVGASDVYWTTDSPLGEVAGASK